MFAVNGFIMLSSWSSNACNMFRARYMASSQAARLDADKVAGSLGLKSRNPKSLVPSGFLSAKGDESNCVLVALLASVRRRGKDSEASWGLLWGL